MHLPFQKSAYEPVGYQYGSPDGFPPGLGDRYLYNPNIDNIYVDGVSGSNPHKHVWVSGVGVVDYIAYVNNCPCNTNSTGTTVPSFVGSNYYCEL